MHRTQLLIPEDLHAQAKRLAKEEGVSLGSLAREALADYVASRTGAPKRAGGDPLLDDPFVDPRAERTLSEDVDHHLYGAARRSKAAKPKPRRKS